MVSTYREFVEEFRLMYNEEIKPLILDGYYETARGLLYNIMFAIKNDKVIFNFHQIPTVHSGFNLLSSIVALYEKLGKSNFELRNTRMLEAYLAQTTLPTQEEIKRTSVR